MRAHLSRAGLLALLASAIDASCDPMGRTGLPVDGTGGATASVSSSVSGTTAASTASEASSSASSGVSSSASGGGAPPTPRRPFLVGASLRVAGTRASIAWSGRDEEADEVQRLAPATRDLLAQTWLRDAQEEHASIAAFARFTLHLLAVGAPPQMIRESQRASLDEVRHAEDCFALARRYGAGEHGPAGLDFEGAMASTSLGDIVAIAAEEGCVGETLGAALAVEQVRRCVDARAKAVLTRIARDESRHAELAWAFVAWAASRGGPEVRERALAAIDAADRASLATPLRSYDGIDLEALRAHGRTTCLEAREITRATLEAVVRPARDRLARATAA